MSKISHNQIASAALKMIDEGKSVQMVVRALASYLISERRTRDLKEITRRMEVQRYKDNGILEAEAMSAHQLTTNVKKQISQIIAAKKIILDPVFDPDVIGGVRVRALDKQLDLSVETKLTTLKHLTVNTM